MLEITIAVALLVSVGAYTTKADSRTDRQDRFVSVKQLLDESNARGAGF